MGIDPNAEGYGTKTPWGTRTSPDEAVVSDWREPVKTAHRASRNSVLYELYDFSVSSALGLRSVYQRPDKAAFADKQNTLWGRVRIHTRIAISAVSAAAMTCVGAATLLLFLALAYTLGQAFVESGVLSFESIFPTSIFWVAPVVAVIPLLGIWGAQIYGTSRDRRDQRVTYLVSSDGVGAAWAAAQAAVDAAGDDDSLRADTVSTIRELMWDGREHFDLVVPQLERVATAAVSAAAARDAQRDAVDAVVDDERERHAALVEEQAQEAVAQKLGDIAQAQVAALEQDASATRAATNEKFGNPHS